MALEGELLGLNGAACAECGRALSLQVCESGAGFYLGYFCGRCGPMSRETGYYPTREIAEANLAKDIPDICLDNDTMPRAVYRPQGLYLIAIRHRNIGSDLWLPSRIVRETKLAEALPLPGIVENDIDELLDIREGVDDG